MARGDFDAASSSTVKLNPNPSVEYCNTCNLDLVNVSTAVHSFYFSKCVLCLSMFHAVHCGRKSSRTNRLITFADQISIDLYLFHFTVTFFAVCIT